MSLLLHHFLENSADKNPDKPALWHKENWYDYRSLEEGANKIAGFLISKNLRKGDRVAMIWENSFHYVAIYYGILKAGGVVVALNTETTPDSIAYLLDNSGARFFFVQKTFARFVKPIKDKINALDGVIWDELPKGWPSEKSYFLWTDIQQKYAAERPQIRIINIDLAAIVYTSGSTGKPKGVTLSHLNICTNTQSIVSYLKLSAKDRIMVILPFYYIYGLSLLNTHIAVGGSLVIDNRFAFPNVVLDTMEKQQVTGFAGVPSTFAILLNKSNVRNRSFQKLRYLTQAGGAMAPVLQTDVAEVFSPAKLIVMYGATEASARLTYLDPEFHSQKLGSIGKAIPNVEVFVADHNGQPLPAGEQGEIVARGANMMQGYWRDPQETAKVVRHGLYFTGDLGKTDEEGFLYVVGRSKDMIKVGANRISAKEIEEAILENENVVEVAVIGVPDDILGEAMDACVVLKERHNGWEKDLLEFTRKKLPPFKVPSYFSPLDALPKNTSGKVMKNKIRKLKGLEV